MTKEASEQPTRQKKNQKSTASQNKSHTSSQSGVWIFSVASFIILLCTVGYVYMTVSNQQITAKFSQEALQKSINSLEQEIQNLRAQLSQAEQEAQRLEAKLEQQRGFPVVSENQSNPIVSSAPLVTLEPVEEPVAPNTNASQEPAKHSESDDVSSITPTNHQLLVQELEEAIELNDYEKQALTAELSDVNRRTESIEEQMQILSQVVEHQSADKQRSNLLLAVIQLKEASQSGKSFTQELETLTSVGQGDQTLISYADRLKEIANQGVTTPKDLQQEFEHIADRISRQPSKENSKSFWESTSGYLKQMVTIRKTDPHATGSDNQAILARSQHLVNVGNFKGAADELQHLQGDAKNIANDWISKANHYVLSTSTIRAMFEHARSLVVENDNGA